MKTRVKILLLLLWGMLFAYSASGKDAYDDYYPLVWGLERGLQSPQTQQIGYVGRTALSSDPLKFSCEEEDRKEYLAAAKECMASQNQELIRDTTDYLTKVYLPLFESKIRHTAMQYAALKYANIHKLERPLFGFKTPECFKADDEFTEFLTKDTAILPRAGSLRLSETDKMSANEWNTWIKYAAVSRETDPVQAIGTSLIATRIQQMRSKYCKPSGAEENALACIELEDAEKLVQASTLHRLADKRIRDGLIGEFNKFIGAGVANAPQKSEKDYAVIGKAWLDRNISPDQNISTVSSFVLSLRDNFEGNAKEPWRSAALNKFLKKINEFSAPLEEGQERQIENLKKFACTPNILAGAVTKYPELILQTFNDLDPKEKKVAQLLFCRMQLRRFFEERSPCSYIKSMRKANQGQDIVVSPLFGKKIYRLVPTSKDDSSYTAKVVVYVFNASDERGDKFNARLRQWGQETTDWYNEQARELRAGNKKFQISFVPVSVKSKHLLPLITLHNCVHYDAKKDRDLTDCKQVKKAREIECTENCKSPGSATQCYSSCMAERSRANSEAYDLSTNPKTLRHEVGHLFGLLDEYTNKIDFLGDVRTKGFFDSFMTSSQGKASFPIQEVRPPKMYPHHLRQIFAPVTECQ